MELRISFIIKALPLSFGWLGKFIKNANFCAHYLAYWVMAINLFGWIPISPTPLSSFLIPSVKDAPSSLAVVLVVRTWWRSESSFGGSGDSRLIERIQSPWSQSFLNETKREREREREREKRKKEKKGWRGILRYRHYTNEP